ncbi:hypothetical protein ACFVH6_37305 [Spirillospora sp. NPDC127200]
MSSRRLSALLATAPVAIATVAVLAGPAEAGATALTCSVRTTQRPVTFTPPLRLQRRPTKVTASLAVDGCTSPSGSHQRLRSGVLKLRGSANAGCTGARNLRGGAVITWYDARGRAAGSSRLVARPGQVVRSSLTDALLAGRVTSGPLAGHRATGRVTPAGVLIRCHSQGLSAAYGSGRLTFR